MKQWMRTFIIFYLIYLAIMIGLGFLYYRYYQELSSDEAFRRSMIFGAILSLITTVIWAIFKPIKSTSKDDTPD